MFAALTFAWCLGVGATRFALINHLDVLCDLIGAALALIGGSGLLGGEDGPLRFIAEDIGRWLADSRAGWLPGRHA